ncbi:MULTISPECIES: DUF3408 domain-containing protein [Chryseobacterium]|uniref:DUF3408 domain-containing protein n=2 Tax=Chryseobacterium TaxID=59732 RepID=A0AAD0YJW0_CHRNA|nr:MULTISPECIES: DUF3408 domain-containing protein [Chryseobacterium]AZA89829.1 DUF3408 domain-containing protein [Chryseobacterium nakagawai]SMP12302.1 Protein of unknown function [Chryseobacterium profundimaris]VEH21232.1 Protein of uncharacterised function (DUF3408) [Chryseobacterium nakagawai]VFA41301.1 Protein of uncharacterised function (DUF3408) [Chryseobacterium indologenes]
MDSDKKNNEDNNIDEQYLMSIMAGNTKNESQSQELDSLKEKPATKQKIKSKKSLEITYAEQFLTHHTMTKRGDKSIYIRPEYHERLSRIIQIIAEDQIPLYAYLDNILAYHFETFEKEITDDFNNKYRPIF